MRDSRARRPGVAVVTGASSGIGRATVRALASAGMTVLGVARREGALARLVAEARPGGVEAVAADVTSARDRERIVRAVDGRPVAALVHGAGAFPRGLLATMPPAQWESAMRTNVDARLWLTLGLRTPLRGGRVLFVGSDASENCRHGGGAYSVSKAASAMLWRSLALELGDEIDFAIARPGLVETRMLDDSLSAPRDSFAAGEVYAAMHERGETITAETVASFFEWLLLDVPPEEFAAAPWDIREVGHHARWLHGPLFRGR